MHLLWLAYPEVNNKIKGGPEVTKG